MASTALEEQKDNLYPQDTSGSKEGRDNMWWKKRANQSSPPLNHSTYDNPELGQIASRSSSSQEKDAGRHDGTGLEMVRASTSRRGKAAVPAAEGRLATPHCLRWLRNFCLPCKLISADPKIKINLENKIFTENSKKI